MTDQRLTSIPPDAKIVTAKGAAVAGIVGHLTETVAVVGSIWLRSIDQMTEVNLMYVIGLSLVGPAISKYRGGPPVGTAAVVLGALPWLAKKIALT